MMALINYNKLALGLLNISLKSRIIYKASLYNIIIRLLFILLIDYLVFR